MFKHNHQELTTKRVLGLKLPTDPRWVNLAEMDLEEIVGEIRNWNTTCCAISENIPEQQNPDSQIHNGVYWF